MENEEKLIKLRYVITENLRVQQRGAKPIPYVNVSNALEDIVSRQNHVVFGRRGCGKTLLLHAAHRRVDLKTTIVLYINCEDYKQHSFPNVLIEIVDRLFCELQARLKGWFGRKRKVRKIIKEIRSELSKLKESADEQATKVKEVATSASHIEGSVKVSPQPITVGVIGSLGENEAIEREYETFDSKIKKLNLLLPRLKDILREYFDSRNNTQTIFVELDDFYHLPRSMHPHVADYVHRLCKDLPLYFKIATLRHSTVLYADRGSQPTGAQERHDYQPINLDFTLADFQKTASQLRQILYRYEELAGFDKPGIDVLFMGEGFPRLVLASGGVPRDFLSLLLENLSQKEPKDRIGKDDVRLLSYGVWRRRIEELKADSEQKEQDALLRGIYAIQKFCAEKKYSAFLVSDRMLQERSHVRALFNRLLDYRIIHSVGSALTHKTYQGTYNAYMIDIGAYANMRKLADRFIEIDITASDAREKLRNCPILDETVLTQFLSDAPSATEAAILSPEPDDSSEETDRLKP